MINKTDLELFSSLSLLHISPDCDYSNNQYQLKLNRLQSNPAQTLRKLDCLNPPKVIEGLLSFISLCLALCGRHILMSIEHLKWPCTFPYQT